MDISAAVGDLMPMSLLFDGLMPPPQERTKMMFGGTKSQPNIALMT